MVFKKLRQPGVYFLAGAVTIVVLLALGYGAMEYTESNAFCGGFCHVMNPERVTHGHSPHAEVDCARCHIGPGVSHFIEAKLYGLNELYRMATGTYERPIVAPVRHLRPARDICETCHWPGKYFQHRLVERQKFRHDEANTRIRTAFLIDIGGQPSEGAPLGPYIGSHWHIDPQVEVRFIATDPLEQDIPWVQVRDRDGRVTEYVSPDTSLPPETIATAPKQLMDCIKCHNRASHRFTSPIRAIDQALADGRIDGHLPFIAAQASHLLTERYPDEETALQAIEELEGFYQTNYPQVYAEKRLAIQEAMAVLKTIYRNNIFARMRVDWRVHPDNVGHSESAGCFRCHDGRHRSTDGQVISIKCNLCHSIPTTVAADRPLVSLHMPRRDEPPSHQEGDFPLTHRNLGQQTCGECHQMARFCANSSCHGRTWRWLSGARGFEHPIPLGAGHAPLNCSFCHQAENLTTVCRDCHEPPHRDFDQGCTACHRPEGWRVPASKGSLPISSRDW